MALGASNTNSTRSNLSLPPENGTRTVSLSRRAISLTFQLLATLVLVLSTGHIIQPAPVHAVKRHDFKTCQQSGFCARNRALADRASQHVASWKSPYSLDSPAFNPADNHFTAHVSNQLFPGIHFSLQISFQKDGVARIKMDEVAGLRQRYNEAANWAVQSPPTLATQSDDFDVDLDSNGLGLTTISYAEGKRHQVQIQHSPLKISFFRDGQPHVVINDKGLLNMEHFRVKKIPLGDSETEGEVIIQDPDHPEQAKVIVSEEAFPGFLPPDESGMWEESFGGKTDSKPKGPESLSLDITFPGYEHVYGIPQHASSLSLKQTRGGDGAYTDPYRLYNLDVFEYDADSEMAIYGAIPFMKAHRAGSTVGVFHVTGSEAWIDITKSATPKATHAAFKHRSKDATSRSSSSSSDAGPGPTTTTTHWMTESGILDLFVFLGPSPTSVMSQYTALTGRIPLPQLFAIAYHQCRWNYQSDKDVLDVQRRFDESDIPLDVIWLDIEYAEEHQYMVWDRRYFPEPEVMQDKLAEKGRKLVAIVDPHIKRNPNLYYYKEAQDLDILCKTPDGKEFEGWCWTGSSAWTDWFNPKSWEWWIKQFRFENFKGSTKNLFVWNDMNEPSIFNGPEITMQKDAVHYGGWEHRDVHNINGMIYQNLTAQGLIEREDIPKRPFVLTRAFYAGSQRFGAMWTGDNLGTWEHLASTVPMLLTNGIAGMTFSGADVGGFFGNPSVEMMVRWYQVGAFSPFFRAHGHIDTKRREPYLFDQPYQGYMRDAIRLRYSLIPALYTAFYESRLTGSPILLPQYVLFPDDPKGFAIDNQFYFANSGLLVKPVVGEGVTESEIYISDDQPYYNYHNGQIIFGAATGGSHVNIPAPLDTLPILQRGGSILTRRDLVRRSAILAWRDPITLQIALDVTGSKASGSLYLDDGESYSNEKGEFIYRSFELAPEADGSKNLVLTSRSLHSGVSTGVEAYSPNENGWAKKISDVVVREIVVLGLASRPACVKKSGSGIGLEFSWTDGVAATAGRRRGGKEASKLVVKDAGALVIEDWSLVFDFGAACGITPAIDYDLALQSPECPTGQFLCKNAGHISSCILRSRVNDGICDPECCDGSDETDGKAACGNRCKEIGAEYRKKADEEARKRRVGAAVRSDYIKHGIKEKAKLESDVVDIEKQIAKLEEREAAAKRALDALESAEAGEIERKKNSQLYAQLAEMQAAIRALRLQRQNLEGHVNDLSGILGDLSRDFNPNYQDMAVLGASRAFKDWKTANGFADAEDEGSEASQDDGSQATFTAKDGEENVKDYTDGELKTMEEHDPLTLIDSLASRVGPVTPAGVGSILRIEDYLPSSWKPKFEEYKKLLVGILSKTGVIPAPSSGVPSDRPELTKARSAHTAITEEIHSAHQKLTDARKSLEKDWGRDWEWKKLDGTCVEKDLGEYTYSVCFFGEATQKSNANHGRTSLGHFSAWSSSAEQGSDAYYEKQVYDNGQRCWNGPARSAKIDLICAPTNALLSVIEPEKCEYLFTVQTPAVCYPKADESKQKDEL
ncbi:hypothetical protein T439DRAFT_326351 [Meredithblackwellia eburnea MCA 4105]